MMDRISEAVEASRELLSACATPHGFVASADLDHYASIWARDACVSGLGAVALGDSDLVTATAATLDTLAGHASPLGQIPAVVRPQLSSWDWAEGGVVDANAWFVILAGRFVTVTGDTEAARRWWPAVVTALDWLAHQDVTGSGLISAAPSTDWMDAALTRSGRTLHLNVLYAWAAAEAARLAHRLGEEAPIDADQLSRRVNAWFWPVEHIDPASLYPHGFAHHALRIAYWESAAATRTHYVSHIIHAAFVDVVDVFANLLAVVSGVAGAKRAEVVLSGLVEETHPYPSRTFREPIRPGDWSGMLVSAAEASIPARWRNRPGSYHNGAVWPYVGGFHVVAEATAGRAVQARHLLERLAEANALDDWSFPEWITLDGEPAGARRQAWNAGAFLLANEAVSGAV